MQAAQDVFNADQVSLGYCACGNFRGLTRQAGDINDILTILPNIISAARDVYTDIPSRPKERSTITKMIFGSPAPKARSISEMLSKSNVKPLGPFMNDLRVYKSEAEIANLRKAGQVSGRAFTEAMRKDFATEKDLETFLEYTFRMNGCEESAYVPVVAGGAVYKICF